MTYPITVYGVEYETTRGWVPLDGRLRHTRPDAEDYLDDVASTHTWDADRLRVRPLHITPAEETE